MSDTMTKPPELDDESLANIRKILADILTRLKKLEEKVIGLWHENDDLWGED